MSKSRTLDEILDTYKDTVPRDGSGNMCLERAVGKAIEQVCNFEDFHKFYQRQMDTIIFGRPLEHRTVPETVSPDYEARAAEYAKSSALTPGPPIVPKVQTALGRPKESFTISGTGGKTWGDGI